MVTEQVEKDIKQTCLQYQIKNFSINPDGSIDVDGNVDLSSRNLTALPLRFRRIMGNFNVQNNNLTTLVGGPLSVGGDFNCFNNELTTFASGPKWIGGDFYAYNNKLISLQGSPNEVVGSYYISGNDNLTSLIDCTLKIGANFSFDDILFSTFSGEEDIEYNGNFFLNETNFQKSDARKLPFEIINNRQHLKLILKYQRYFEIWNEDLSFNVENWNVFICEINEGLQ